MYVYKNHNPLTADDGNFHHYNFMTLLRMMEISSVVNLTNLIL